LKLPRDLSGRDLALLLAPYGYAVTRQTGSHLRLTSALKGPEHHVTIPQHKALTVGTLNAILTDVADYLDMDRAELSEALFAR